MWRACCCLLLLVVAVGCSRQRNLNLNKQPLYGIHKWTLDREGLNDGSGLVSVAKAVSRLDRSSDAVHLSVEPMVEFSQYREVALCLYTNCIVYAVCLDYGKCVPIFPFSDSELAGCVLFPGSRSVYFFASDVHFARYPSELLGAIEVMEGEESGFDKWFLELQNREPFVEDIPECTSGVQNCLELWTSSNVRFGDIRKIFSKASEKGYDVLCWCCRE